MDIDGGNPKQLTDGGADVTPGFSTDGGAILYLIDRARSSSLWSQPAGGGPPKLLADFTPGQIFSFAVSRDGKSLAFARGTLLRDVVLIGESERGRLFSSSLGLAVIQPAAAAAPNNY